MATILSLSLLFLKKNIFLLFLLYSVRLSLSLFFSLSSLFSVHLFVFSSFHRFSLSHRWIVMVVDRGLRISVVVNRGPFSLLFLGFGGSGCGWSWFLGHGVSVCHFDSVGNGVLEYVMWVDSVAMDWGWVFGGGRCWWGWLNQIRSGLGWSFGWLGWVVVGVLWVVGGGWLWVCEDGELTVRVMIDEERGTERIVRNQL